MIEDRDYRQYHIDLSRNLVEDARAAVIPGAPERAELIASGLENPQKIASHRGLDSWLGRLEGYPVLVTNTGMGGPTTEIVVQELIQLGVTVFLRIGTTGAIRPEIPVGSLVISEAAIRLDGTSDHYAPPCYPAVADFELTEALKRRAKNAGASYISGITVSSATFYPGQERYDSASGYVQRSFRGSLEEWRALGALNYEMESGALFTMCRTMGLRAGCICAVVANRAQSEKVVRDVIRKAEEQAATIGLRALADILISG
ncbi:MAG: uridine phosphorylase [Myxococcales bacterium]|nr:MAG: uridine phosphorylase [Myxococcales bacterium]